MKKLLTGIGAIAAIVSINTLAAAWPGNGGGIKCNNCHTDPRTDGFILTGADGLINGKDAFLVAPGQSRDIGISVTNSDYAYGLGLFGLPGTGLTPDADWFEQGGGQGVINSYTATPEFLTTEWVPPGPDPWTFTVGVPADQPAGDYLLEIQMGVSDFTSQARDFYVSVVPEPSSAWLLWVGGLGLVLCRRRGIPWVVAGFRGFP